MNIKKVIIPVGGFGTRFLPATKAQPKEMLALVDKPVIQYLVEEAVESGIREIIFVTGRGKRAIEDHFDYSLELEHFLESRGKKELADRIHGIASMAKFTYVRQGEPKGPGHALLQASHLIGHDEPIAVLYGDDVVVAKTPCLLQLMSVYEQVKKPVIALERVSGDDVSRYGIVAAKKAGRRLYNITGVVEKPERDKAPSDLAVIGKYIYTPELFSMLPQMKPSRGGEYFPTGVFDIYVKKGGQMYGYEYEGERYDCGEKLGFLKATVRVGMQHPDVGKEFKHYLKGLNLR